MPEMTIQQAFDLALVLHKAGKLSEAEAIYQQILIRMPNSPNALHLMGVIAGQTGKPEAGVELIKRAISLRPQEAGYYINLGIALQALGRSGEAIAAYFAAIKLRPDFPQAYCNLGVALLSQDRFDEGVIAYREALRIKTDDWEAYEGLGIALKHQGHIAEAIDVFRKCLEIKPGLEKVHSNLIHTLHFHWDSDARAIYQEERRWNQQHTVPLRTFIPPHFNDPDPKRQLRIGYVSSNFYAQSESFFVLPLFESHDHKQFKIYCYSSVKRPDQITDRLRQLADVWRDVIKMSDEELAQQIRNDQIDILIDLTMHMANNRLLAFARKPVPIQVAWLAYPGSTGLETIDYRLSDNFLDPVDMPTQFSSEEPIRLPDCWCCYDPLCDFPPRPVQQDGPICFGSLNHPS
ncbi:MAG TPA: tetratricopeptide repeat protein, partial [Phycisphaerae bacterium]|nr:tetratricopeptide repeat protein [Phycisphaerae bacterium]